jgi:hypothetical protein
MSWTKIQGDELQRLQTRLEMPPQTAILEASTLRTPFYHNGELVKMNDAMGTMFMVLATGCPLMARLGPSIMSSIRSLWDGKTTLRKTVLNKLDLMSTRANKRA